MRQPRKNPLFFIIICMVLLMLAQTFTSFAVVLLHGGALFREDMTLEEADAAMLEIMYANQTEILLISYAIVLIGLGIMVRRREQSVAAFTSLKRSARLPLMVLSAVAGLALAFWATIAVNLIPWPEAMLEAYQTESAALATTRPVLDFLTVVLAAPLVEEMLFRGVIYDSFCQVVPAGAAVIFQGMLFGSIHGTAIWMLYACLCGCLLGYVRKRTGSLRPCVLMHMVFNASAYLFDWFAAGYGEDQAAITLIFVVSAFVLLLSVYGISFRTANGDERKNS